MNVLLMNANPLRLAARGLEAVGSVGAPATRKIAAYLAINREMTPFAARITFSGH
jgi:hypothetical protein